MKKTSYSYLYLTLSFLCCIIINTTVQAQTEFEQRMQQLGYDMYDRDWSDSTFVSLQMPVCGYVNITGVKKMPTSKAAAPLHAYMEFYDGCGNYMKKKVLLKLQGQSSRRFPKKCFGAEFCEDEWIGEETTDVEIGNWVPQDGFHWKAYYSDYFRGIGTIGYKLYDQIVSDRPRPWENAAEQGDYSDRALGHVDGFPCAVYLNGDYYGLFSCELKKHRKNMNMVKDAPEQIYLDQGYSHKLILGNLRWMGIRNPKVLYTMDGEVYDRDNPKELIDSTSEFFALETDSKKVKKQKAATARTKQYIINFSQYHTEIKNMRSAKINKDIIKDTISRHFDVPSMIDFWIFSLVTSNYDNLESDQQWFTYDGVKWSVAPYDLDVTFGYHNYGYFLFPPNWTSNRGPMTYKIGFAFTPFQWLNYYFLSDVKSRYAELRNKGILSTENIMSIIDTWRYGIGESIYTREWEKWPDSPGITPLQTNENWEDPNTWNGYKACPYYSDTVTYHAGDNVVWNFKKWTVTGTTKGVVPAKLGCLDSPERIRDWISRRLLLEDGYMEYEFQSQQISVTMSITSIGWSTICVPFQFVIPDNLEVYSISGVDEQGALIKERVYSTEAHRPYLVKGFPGDYVISGYTEEASETDPDYLRNGCLHGTYFSQFVPQNTYVLQNHNGKAAFYKVEEEGKVRVSPYKAWLEMNNNSPKFLLPLESEGTKAIAISDSPTEIQEITDVSGVKRNIPSKNSINIVRYSDGTTKKVVIVH